MNQFPRSIQNDDRSTLGLGQLIPPTPLKKGGEILETPLFKGGEGDLFSILRTFQT
jgi:hypothetical protein